MPLDTTSIPRNFVKGLKVKFSSPTEAGQVADELQKLLPLREKLSDLRRQHERLDSAVKSFQAAIGNPQTSILAIVDAETIFRAELKKFSTESTELNMWVKIIADEVKPPEQTILDRVTDTCARIADRAR